VRREWVAFHQGWSTIQRRRAEQLGRIVRKRQRIRTTAVPDPHDDTLLDPLWIRAKKSRASQVEFILVLVAAALAPIGWPAGRVLKAWITGVIPQTLRGYPIAALVWSGAGLGVLTVRKARVLFEGDYLREHITLGLCHHPARRPGRAFIDPALPSSSTR
jgi:hypothetical protein